jgi:hypothetical protein
MQSQEIIVMKLIEQL